MQMVGERPRLYDQVVSQGKVLLINWLSSAERNQEETVTHGILEEEITNWYEIPRFFEPCPLKRERC